MSERPDAPAAEEPFTFAEEIPKPAASGEAPWKILIADDDNEVHRISHLVLRDFSFEGRGLEFFGAHSGAQAKELVARHPDAAILLLDVVMETEDAGLDVVRYVRNVLRNNFLRIILRTGQPGQAPEKSVVVDYDINDYKEKTELTAQKLITTVVAALRAYRDIQIIENSRRGLEYIVAASGHLFEPQSLSQFSQGVLKQLTSLLQLDRDSLLVQSSGFAAKRNDEDYLILAGTGQFLGCGGRTVRQTVSEDIYRKLVQASSERRTLIGERDFVGYFRTSSASENLIYLQSRHQISALDVNLLRLFTTNIAIAFDNVYLNEELIDTQVELIHTLGEVVETRSEETGRHVFRVGECARLLGELAGLGERECELLRLAAPLHDLGKIGIPDHLLNKPGRLTQAEFEVVKTHAAIGYNILKGSSRTPFRTAAIIAHQHHEWWNGAGYPQGLQGEDIHLFGRIVAVADVFDALAHDRHYKPAWPLDQVLDYIRDEGGTHFDPKLVDIFFGNVDAFVGVLEKHPNIPADAGAIKGD